MDESRNVMNAAQTSALLSVLQSRFEHTRVHFEGVAWPEIELALQQHATALWSLAQMEASGGEPSVLAYAPDKGLLWFADASPESPKALRRGGFNGSHQTPTTRQCHGSGRGDGCELNQC